MQKQGERKKGNLGSLSTAVRPRGRGKTAVEDEDSMDGLETAETENILETDIKEQSAEEDTIPRETENSKQLTPIIQHSFSEEFAKSIVSGAEANSSEHLCAFCYCDERSLLGQGELKQFGPTPGFVNPWKKNTISSDSTCDVTPRKHTACRPKVQRREHSPRHIKSCIKVSTRTVSDESTSKFWDELCLVGLPDDIDVQALFEPTGHCWAHHRCAEWSQEMCQTEDQGVVNIDKAVISGSTERCAYCKHLGATIKCCEEKCTQTYHYPCAAGAGTFQDFSHLSLLCPEHIDQAPERSKEEANCAVCDSFGDLLDQLFCTTCGQHYHGMCLDIAVTPLKRAGWQCPDCKVCQNCKHSGEDNKMLVCDTCDKGYHTFCLQPIMDSVPTNGWKCKNCRVCAECGTRTSFQWHHNCLLCDSCYKQQDNLICSLCGKSYPPGLQKTMLCCQMCKRWFHIECDKSTENELDSQQKDNYICTLCKQVHGERDQMKPCDGMEVTDLVSQSGTDDMEVDASEKITFHERALIDDGLSPESTVQNSQNGHLCDGERRLLNFFLQCQALTTFYRTCQEDESATLEAKVSHQDNPDETESSHLEMAAQIEDSQTEQTMEVTKGADMVLQRSPIHEQKDKHLSQEDDIPNIITEDAPTLAPEAIVVTPDSCKSANEEDTQLKREESLEVAGVQDYVHIPEKEVSDATEVSDLEMESTPATENFAEISSPVGDKSMKSPTEIDSPLTSVDTSKTSVSSSPAVSLDLHSTAEMFPSHTLAVNYPVGSTQPAAYVSLTPKIGMGKPAITKRKFSPGRPRSRQGAWSTNNSMSPPSWSPDGSEGRDIFKTRQLLGGAIWSIKVGRGSGFPGKRRPRGSGLSGRGGRGRSKLKNGIGTIVIPGVTAIDISSIKDEEENSMHNTVVLFSSNDKFTLYQDMCVVCGSFGQGAEGRLLACSQCGQCYHPYCVSIKITKVILSKGWRCLECTVCEACGKATDPGRLLLCDDCDISYHTYCLNPPLQTVPKGSWKCKWCVWCTHCGAISPGLRCEWQNNYTQCAPCASLSTCPVCCSSYREGELMLQCRHCDRWIHASCQCLNTEEEVENAADNGFDCTMCRPYITPTHVPSTDGCESPVVAHIVTKVKEPDPPKTYTQDGVCLTESGMLQLQSLSIMLPRRKRSKPKLKLKIINQNSVAVLQTPPDPQSEHSRDGEMDDREGDLVDCDVKSDSSPDRETIDDDTKGCEGTDGIKKRKRKPYRPGIGGFMVRQRSRTGQVKKRCLSRKDSSGSITEQLPGRDDGWSEQLPETPVDESVPGSESTEKIKKRYRKKKNKLEETFPTYLQEAFFGKDLLETSRQSKMSLQNLSEEQSTFLCKTTMNTSVLDTSSDPLLTSALVPAKQRNQGGTQDSLADLSEDDILGIFSDDLEKSANHSGLDLCTFQAESSPSPFAGLNIGPVPDDASSLTQPSVNQSSRPLSEEQLDGILSPELDKMVTDGAILDKMYKIPELEGKDVEDLFTAVLSPVTSQPLPHPQLMPLHSQDGVFTRVPMMNGLIGSSPHLPHNPMPSGPGLGNFSSMIQPPYADTRTKNPAFTQMMNDHNNSWTAPAPVIEGEGDTMSNSQRSTLKWEKEEVLGEMATVAPVLYTNINFPNLKEDFPDWATRVKQIAKLWRKASSQERAPYVQKARDNRAALRINKVQMSNDSMKRQQQQQQQDIIDTGSRIDTDLFKDPLKQRESEHEQEWKFRQQMRQKSKQQAKIEATQKLEQVKNEQQQQQQFSSQQLANHSGSDTPNSGIQSPLTPQQVNGSMSPAQQAFNKDLFTKQQVSVPPPSTSSDDVFLKPQAPAPTPTRTSVHDQLSITQASQPHSPQMFSPGSNNSRPSSPLDPYAKMVGTPRPSPVGQNFIRRNFSSSVDTASDTSGRRSSPVRDSCCSSPLNDPYAKPPDTPRPAVTVDQFPKPLGISKSPINIEQLGKGPLVAGGNDPFMKPPLRNEMFSRQSVVQIRMGSADPYIRPPSTPASNVDSTSGPFKTPMRPPQSPQDPYASMPSTPRHVSGESYERTVLTSRPLENFSHNQSSEPYSQPSLTSHSAVNDSFVHPQRIRQQSDPFSQSGPMSRSASQDPYAQPPGTPHPVSASTPRPTVIDSYIQPPSLARPPPQPSDSYSQPLSTPRPAMGDLFVQPALNQRHSDSYTQPPGTPRPIDAYSQTSGTPRPVICDPYSQPTGITRITGDPYSQPPATPRSVINDLYAQPPATPRSVIADPYCQPPGTPRPAIPESFSRPVTRPSLLPNQGPFKLPPQNRDLSQSTFVRPSEPCSQTLRSTGPATSETFSLGSAVPKSEPYDQTPITPQPQSRDNFGTNQLAHEAVDQQKPGSDGNYNSSANSPLSIQGQPFTTVSKVPGSSPNTVVTDVQSTINMPEAEEKLRQRLKLRELILQQQRQKNAGRQEKVLQDPTASSHSGPLPCWQQETLNRQNEIFNRPPPPYPGNIKGSNIPLRNPRFPGFPKEQHGPFSGDGQFNRSQFPGDASTMGLRPHNHRLGFPGGNRGLIQGQERLIGPPQQIQGPGIPQQIRRPLSLEVTRPMNNPQINNSIGHFPPQSLPIQQHNISGQAYIELRHRAPDSRPRLFFGPSGANVIEVMPHHPRHGGFISRQNFQGPRLMESVRSNQQSLGSQIQMPTRLDNLSQPQQDQIHPPVLLMHSLNQPVSDVFSAPPSAGATNNIQIPNQTAIGLEVKLDSDDPSVKDIDVKDLDGVEVKDLDDEDLENLNLDTEDGKGDELDTLDNLETNDPHLDDLLRSGEFDIIAYTDPELDLGDKKDMFNEELDLSVPVEDKLDIQCKTAEQKSDEKKDKTDVCSDAVASFNTLPVTKDIKSEALSPNSQEKSQSESKSSDEAVDSACQENDNLEDDKTESMKPSSQEIAEKTNLRNEKNNLTSPSVTPGPPQLSSQGSVSSESMSGSTPVISNVQANERLDNSDLGPLGSPPQSLPPTQPSYMSAVPQTLMTPAGQILEHTLNSNLSMGSRLNRSFSQGVNSGFMQGQPTNHNFGTGQPPNQAMSLPSQPGSSNMSASQQIILPQAINQQNRERPLLLDEQPLLLQDLLDQERQEQQQQRQMQAMIRNHSEPFFPNIDFDVITDPIMKAKMVALKGINKVMAQNNMGMPTMVINSPHARQSICCDVQLTSAFPQRSFSAAPKLRFPFIGRQITGTPSNEGQNLIQQGIGQDGNTAPQMTRPNPPNFDSSFVNESQKKQYEEWLQETQKLLQIQQKFLEEQIGAHRKSKKALSAKQRTARKAGREFPEEDAEQLKNVTEQQSMVQKQLEQIRKQQKEHAELIEEYRIKQQQEQQQQCTMVPSAMMPGIQPQLPLVPRGTPPSANQQNFSVVQPQLQHHANVIPGQSNPARMPNLPGWQPSSAPQGIVTLSAPRIQPPMAQIPLNTSTPTPVSGSSANAQSSVPPRVEFEDNNPFSESFQERERKERLREQQERQRVQLMQEVDRQRALQQKLEMEQHGVMGSELNNRTSLSFFASDMPSEFLQHSRPLQQPPQQQMGQVLSQKLHQGSVSSPPAATFLQSTDRKPVGLSTFGMDPALGAGESPSLHSAKQLNGGMSGTSFAQTQVRSPFGLVMHAAIPVTENGPPHGQDLNMTHASSQSLIQLYSDIIPEEKGKKKRNRKKKKDDDTDSIKTPSTPHSDITAPPTPNISDSVCTPTVSIPGEPALQAEQELTEQQGSSTPSTALNQLPQEMKHHLPNGDDTHKTLQKLANTNSEIDDAQTGSLLKTQEIKLERAEDYCHSQDVTKIENPNDVKMEEEKTPPHSTPSRQSPAHTLSGSAPRGESGHELLKHLLKNKKQSADQQTEDCLQSEEKCLIDKKLIKKQDLGETMMAEHPLQAVFGNQSRPQKRDSEQERKKPRSKRAQKTGEKVTPWAKKRKKDEEERQAICSHADTFTRLKQELSLLPLMEPIIGVNFAHFLPYGSGQINGRCRLLGAFGNAALDGVSDYYSQLIYKQNNLSNPPTPPASLPPTPPPVTCQKMVNGFATTEELAVKDGMLGHDVTKVLGHKQFQLPFRSQDDLIARAMAQGHKTVDVPASFPTPPHNNQEELRVQDHCDGRDTPDSFVPSSSPESVVGMEISRYPDLSLIKEEPPDPVPSPIIPILPSSTGKGSEASQNEVKTEPSSGTLFFESQFIHTHNGPKSGLISVAITLHPTAAENINSVVSAFADLLNVRIPSSYEISDVSEPTSMGFINSHRINPSLEYRQQLLLHGPRGGAITSARLMGSYGLKHPHMSFTPNRNGIAGYQDHSRNVSDYSTLRPQWCSQCKVVVLGSGVRKSFKDLPVPKQEPQESTGRMENEIVFCSNNCFLLYSVSAQAKKLDKEAIPLLPQSPIKETPPKAFHQYSNNTSTLDVHCLPHLQEKVSSPTSPPINFPSASSEATKMESKPDELKVTVKLKPRLRAVHSNADDSRPLNKKWKGSKWKKWSIQIVIPKGTFKPQCEGEIDEFLKKLGTSLKPDPIPKDYRKCCFCHEEGDGLTDGPARLLNLDLDLWVHLNCALWSTEVYETQAGALINVELALRRGLQMKCVFCHKMGATSGCHRLRCTNIYHFTCAIKAQCMFFKDKTMLCPMHKPKGAHEQELTYFAVFRRVYVQRDEVRQIASIVQRGERDHIFRVGSLIFHTIGQLLPQQMQAFHSSTALFPVGYEASRFYWSMRYANKRCRYLCSIEETDGFPVFQIRVIEQGHEDLILCDTTPKGVWDKILDPVADIREDSELLRLFPGYLKGEDLFGLTVSAVTRIAESLPGVEACETYNFRYGRNPLMELPLAINPTGCARSEPKMSTHVKRFVLRPHTLNSTSTSKSFQSTVTGELNAPYSKQFVHSKSSQYRKMKTEWKSSVYLARSRIQGLGLYAARDIEKHTMVIEYIGTIIRNEVANRKEKLYESQNRGVYMFRIDNDHVIDATLTGGPARYINHSCAPNCVAEVVTFEKGHKIIISSNRRIQKGEELCYDYKFDFEDDQHKIPCHCGAVNCRKWMN
uniref:Histone-lysine N-methyltransferase 2C n=1 Tax=Geotrypetes seraphini TaxID=260995 RepID=A0A6P8PUK1_GEOSA|nr:histone-lysine N-methyltransferase 2C isoform X5 [Geotrypetes seraphini]